MGRKPNSEVTAEAQTKQAPPAQPKAVAVVVLPKFAISSKSGYLIGETGAVPSEENAKTIVTPAIGEDLGGKKILVGIQADKPFGKMQVGVQLSFDGSQYSKPVVTEAVNIESQALHVVSLDMQDYKGPFYRIIMKAENDIPQGQLVQVKFCV